MKVVEALQKTSPTISFEFFPPKTPAAEVHLFEVLTTLKQFSPDYVSVTYGALGTNREKSFFWVKKIKDEFGLEPVAHLTCVAASKKEMLVQLQALWQMGIENILALRGDPPVGESNFTPPPDGFAYAKELVAFIKENFPGFCVGVAVYPEGHPTNRDLSKEVEYFAQKAAAGADYAVTQLFFDNHYYFDFVKECRQQGIKIPIVPGMMPITSFKSIQKMTSVCGASVPLELLAKLEKHQHAPEKILEIGTEQAIKQANELWQANVPGLHFFVMNQADPISKIITAVRPPQSLES